MSDTPSPGDDAETTDSATGGDRSPAPDPAPRILNSADLLQGRREVFIEHGEQMYCLRLTSSGKLYLSK